MLKQTLTAAALMLAAGLFASPGLADDDWDDDGRAVRERDAGQWMEGRRPVYLGEPGILPRGDRDDDDVASDDDRDDDDDDDRDDDRDDGDDDDGEG